MPDILRPPPHRGPLIAAGAVVLTTGLALLELRLELAAAVHVLILGAVAALVLALGTQAPNEDGRPPAYQSVLLVTGLLLLYAALLRLADALGADFDTLPAGALVWTGVLQCAASLWIATQRRSAVCLLIAAIAGGIALLAAFDWIFDPGTFTASRWILLLIAIGLAVGSLALRAGAPRHAEMLVDGAGLAILAIGLQAVVGWLVGSLTLLGVPPDTPLPNFWELVLVGAGCGLVAYGAVDRAPGPAWLGVANLAVFALLAGAGSDETLYWWPLLLILIGAGAMAAGLRPRRPLPP
ncbi:MAG: hypothetical protein ACRDPC_25480, partial [Solirubrobacteraceae bacterium]